MSITLAQAEEILDSLVEASLAGVSEFQSVSIAGRTVTYSNAADLQGRINYWQRIVNGLKRKAAGGRKHSFAVADFRSTR